MSIALSEKLPSVPVETLQSALAYLMSRHTMITCQHIEGCPACSALSIAQHLQLLLHHPDLNSHALQSTYASLLPDWQGLAVHHEQQAAMKHQSENRTQLRVH